VSIYIGLTNSAGAEASARGQKTRDCIDGEDPAATGSRGSSPCAFSPQPARSPVFFFFFRRQTKPLRTYTTASVNSNNSTFYVMDPPIPPSSQRSHCARVPMPPSPLTIQTFFFKKRHRLRQHEKRAARWRESECNLSFLDLLIPCVGQRSHCALVPMPPSTLASVRLNLVPCFNLVLPLREPPAHTFRALESC